MNYLIELLAFHDLLLSESLSAGQIALWHALMYIDNKCGWPEWFSAPSRTLELHSGLSRDGIAKARTVLCQKGLIEMRKNGTKATAYRMTAITDRIQDSLKDRMQDRIQDSLQDSLQNSTTFLNKNKINKNKINIYTRTRARKETIVRRSKFNNYEDTNKIDYAVLEQKLLERQLEEVL